MRDVYIAFRASIGVLIVLGVMCLFLATPASSQGQFLMVTFLNVGQGDAILVESPTGTQVLIDGGKDRTVLGELEKQLGFFDAHIDMVVATHADADHIGGLIDVLERYDVDTVLMTENVNDTPVYRAFMEKVEAEGASVLYARAGQVYVLGEGVGGAVSLRVLFPDHDPTQLETNTASIVAQLVYGESEYLLTGDAPKQIETYLVGREGAGLSSDVLKVGHHGSKTSTADLFVSAVAPQYAIISAGRDNSYGHPHADVVETLRTHGVTQMSTAEEGTISSFSDGVSVWFE